MRRLLIIMFLISPVARAQWTEPVQIGPPGGYQYPQILAAGDTLHVIGTDVAGGDKVVYLRSDDGGDTWGECHILSDTANSDNAMFVRILKNEQGIMVLWRSILISGLDPWNIGYALSHDNGDTWAGPLYVLNPGWDHILYFGASGSGPVVNVILSSRISPDLVFFNIRSTDFGQSWSEPVELFSAAQSGFVDQVGSNDIVHFAWGGRFVWDVPWETYYMRSTDGGISWSDNVALSELDEHGSFFPSLCVNEMGYVGLTWMDYKYSPYGLTGDIFFRSSLDFGETWTDEVQITEMHRSTLSDVVWSGDTVCVVWQDERPENGRMSIYFSKSTDGGLSWSSEYRLDNSTDESREPSIAISNGRIYVVWWQGSDESGYGLYFSRYEEETDIVGHDPIMPTKTSLRAYPNPFNSNALISLSPSGQSQARIDIYEIGGRLVRTLTTVGGHVTWDATDSSGRNVSSGIYFVRTRVPRNSATIKLLYLK